MYSSLASLSHLLSFVLRRLPNSRPATMVKPRFTIDVQTFTNLLLLVVPGGAVYFWTRGDQLDEEAMAAKMTKEHGYPGTVPRVCTIIHTVNKSCAFSSYIQYTQVLLTENRVFSIT